MDIAILSNFGFEFILRWIHFFAGVIWIGLLYYFNFVQGEWFKETDAPTKSAAVQKLVPRALMWFRHGALWTFLSGVGILANRAHHGGWQVFSNSWGVFILTGATLATLMFLNVWLIIWPKQKIVIASARQAATGGQALPNAAAAAARAGVASRTNVLFSIPMLFFMGAASHLGLITNTNVNFKLLTIVLGSIIGLIELNAIFGKTGPLTTVKGVIASGFTLAAALYLIIEVLV